MPSSKGLKYGKVYENRAFFHVRPGHAEELAAACVRFVSTPGRTGLEGQMQTGIHDQSLTVFDDGTRFLFATTFDTEWDPYFEDSVSVVGAENYYDFLKHCVEVPEGLEDNPPTADEFSAIVDAQRVTAASYIRLYENATNREIIKALDVQAAFQKVLDDPAAAEALQHPALKPLLDQAAV